MMEQNTESRSLLRLLILFVAVLTIAGLIAGLFIWAPWSSGSDDSKTSAEVKNFTLTQDESSMIKNRATEVLKGTGTFGVNDTSLTKNNIQEIGYIVSRQDIGWEDYVTSRADSYNSVRDKIMRNSPADYSQSTTAKWDYGNELDTLKSFVLDSSEVSVPTEGTLEGEGDEKSRYVRVKVNFTSTVTQRLVTAEDVSWDGSYRILQKNMTGSATLVFQDYAGEWLLRDVEDPRNVFLLSLWSPNYEADGYNENMFDFKEVEIVTPDEPYTPPTEGSK